MPGTVIEAFLAYNELEASLVQPVNDWLTREGIATHFWQHDRKVGDPISEERELRAARTIVVFLGNQGWGPTQIELVSAAAARQVPLLPVVIGDPPIEALDAVHGLFKEKKYVDLRKHSPSGLEELRDQIRRHSSEGVFDPLIRELTDGDEEDRQTAFDAMVSSPRIAQRRLANLLRAQITGPFSYRAQRGPGPYIRSPDKLGSIRSWMLSVLVRIDTEDSRTRDLVLDHLGPDEIDPSVGFWALAGVGTRRASYLKDAIAIAEGSRAPAIVALANPGAPGARRGRR